MSPPTINWW